jgi:hypothetical protein
MPGGKPKGREEPTLLEVAPRVQDDFRSQLAPLRAMPLQASVILYLHRQKEAKVTETRRWCWSRVANIVCGGLSPGPPARVPKIKSIFKGYIV